MKFAKPLLIFVVGALFIYLLVSDPNSNLPLTNRTSKKAKSKSVPAPDFALKDLDGKVIKLSNFNGKVVVLNFWATWCPPCRQEIPDLIDAQKRYKEKGVEFIGIALDQGGRSVVEPFVKNTGFNYTILLDDEGSVAGLYGEINSIPTTFFVDRNGQIKRRYNGMISQSEIDSALNAMLSEQ